MNARPGLATLSEHTITLHPDDPGPTPPPSDDDWDVREITEDAGEITLDQSFVDWVALGELMAELHERA